MKSIKRTRKRTSKKETNEIKIPNNLLPTGCTLLNCACSDNAFGGYRRGTIVTIIGDSSAGKTILGYTSLAALAADKKFNNYRFILDDAERAKSFKVKNLFGKKLAKRLEPPGWEVIDEEKREKHSDTVQDFHMFVKDAIEKKEPFVYVLDSWDSLDEKSDQEYINNIRKKRKKGEETNKGTYGTAKAKAASLLLRNIRADIKKTNSLIIIIYQVRENLNAGLFGKKKVNAGGKAPRHYSWHEIWLYLGSKIKNKKEKVGLQLGVNTKVAFEKNRQTGKLRNIDFPIFYELGIDDVQANVDFVTDIGKELKIIKRKKNTFIIPELNYEGTKNNLIQHVEKNDLEVELQKLVQRVWLEREEQNKINRKKRFE